MIRSREKREGERACMGEEKETVNRNAVKRKGS